jgi:hypothetical protein
VRVSGGELMNREFRFANPFYRRAAEGLRLTRKHATSEEFQANPFVSVDVGDVLQQALNGRFNAQFFTKFTDQAFLEGFVRLAFTAGKFPQAAEVRITSINF